VNISLNVPSVHSYAWSHHWPKLWTVFGCLPHQCCNLILPFMNHNIFPYVYIDTNRIMSFQWCLLGSHVICIMMNSLFIVFIKYLQYLNKTSDNDHMIFHLMWVTSFLEIKVNCYSDRMTWKAAAWVKTHTHTHTNNMLIKLMDGLQDTGKLSSTSYSL
jgi:hypothetical protein